MLSFEELFLHDFELKSEFFSAKHTAQVELPEPSREPKGEPTLVQIHQELQADGAPKIRQRDVRAQRLQSYVRVKRKELAILDEAIEGITVEVIAVRGIGSPIRIRIVRSSNCDASARFRDSMQLSNERHDVGNMFGYMAANDLVEFIVWKWIRY